MSKGFTMIEIMIASSVLAILGGIGYSTLNPRAVRLRTEDSIRLANIQKLAEGLEAYKQIERTLPIDTDGDGDPTNDVVNVNIHQFVADWPDGRPTSATQYNYVDSGNTVFGLVVARSDGRIYKYRSSTAWGKRVRECGSTAVPTNDLCP